ncbi:MAG: isocitrate lyase/PEP mutase family protein [Acidimicrobiales bacterium]
MGSFFGTATDGGRRLRALLDAEDTILAPGAYDALSARLVEAAGFPAVYMTGFGTVASVLGRPDVGLLTMSEMVEHARQLVGAVDVPVIADADTGYGNSINVIRTVQEYAQAGVAALHIEDQEMPKKCGHVDTSKRLVPASEMATKVAAAVAARGDHDLVVIARTDARSVEGLDAALDRARRYRDAGADVLFVEAPQCEEEIEAVASALDGTPLLFNWAEGGKTPAVRLDWLRELGFRIVLYPISTLLAATRAVREVLDGIRTTGTPAAAMDRLVPFGEFLDFIGMSEIEGLEARFAEIGPSPT